MKKLVFDADITGHHSEYIDHLISYLVKFKSNDTYIFVVHTDFKSIFPEIVKKTIFTNKIRWIYLQQKELDDCKKNNVILKSLSYFRIMNKYALRYEVSHSILLYFNIFQFALIVKRPPYTLSGILFLQFYRMNANTLKLKLKYYRKYITTYLYTLNRKIDRVYILNDNNINKLNDTPFIIYLKLNL